MKRLPYVALALLFVLLLPAWSGAQNVQSYVDQGIKASQSGRYDQALEAFDQALKLKPNDPAIVTYKGIVFYAQGKDDLALKQFEAALKLNPNFGRAYYQRALILEKQEKFEQAVADLRKAKSLGYNVEPNFIALMETKAAAQR